MKEVIEKKIELLLEILLFILFNFQRYPTIFHRDITKGFLNFPHLSMYETKNLNYYHLNE